MFTLWPLACSNSGTSSASASFAEIVLQMTISALRALPAPVAMARTVAAAAKVEKRIVFPCRDAGGRIILRLSTHRTPDACLRGHPSTPALAAYAQDEWRP